MKDNRLREQQHHDNIVIMKRQQGSSRQAAVERKRQEHDQSAERLLDGMRQRTRVGKNSVAYNLINHQYEESSAGATLLQSDRSEKVFYIIFLDLM